SPYAWRTRTSHTNSGSPARRTSVMRLATVSTRSWTTGGSGPRAPRSNNRTASPSSRAPAPGCHRPGSSPPSVATPERAARPPRHWPRVRGGSRLGPRGGRCRHAGRPTTTGCGPAWSRAPVWGTGDPGFKSPHPDCKTAGQRPLRRPLTRFQASRDHNGITNAERRVAERRAGERSPERRHSPPGWDRRRTSAPGLEVEPGALRPALTLHVAVTRPPNQHLPAADSLAQPAVALVVEPEALGRDAPELVHGLVEHVQVQARVLVAGEDE